jgi:predicted transglutaminase-like protease
MQTRVIISADDGKVLTNGKVYGEVIYLAYGANKDEYYEITIEEYEAIQAAQEALEELEG